MEDLNNVSITHANLVPAQTPSESAIINMEMEPAPRGAIIIEAEEETTTTPPFPIPATAKFQNYTAILYLVYAAALLYMFPSLIALVGIKFQNKAHSPFETDSLFANMAVVAYIIAIPLPIALFCLRARLDRESSPPIYYRILQCVLCFWTLLAPLSFVLVLFLPHGFGLIGYLTVSALFVVVVACSFSDYIKLPCNSSTLEARTRNDTWSHSTLTITEE